MPPPAQTALGPSGNKVSTVSRPYSFFSRFDLLLHHTKTKMKNKASNQTPACDMPDPSSHQPCRSPTHLLCLFTTY
ncbi:hypothetical protein V8C44DRAFT_338992 [Trichoderma aethiopicum]